MLLLVDNINYYYYLLVCCCCVLNDQCMRCERELVWVVIVKLLDSTSF